MQQAIAAPRLLGGARSGILADWLAIERGRGPLWLPVFMGAGVLVYFALVREPPGWAGGAVFAPAALGAALARQRAGARAVFLMLAAAAAGFASAQFAASRALPVQRLPSRATIMQGTVRAVELLPEGRRIMLEGVSLDGAEPVARRLRIRLRAADPAAIETGDTVALRGMVRRPAAPAYPGAWDLQRDTYFNGIGGYGYALGPVQVLSHDAPGGTARAVQWLRDTIAARTAAALPGTEGAIAATLLTGNPSAIPEADRAAFRDSGLAHLLAVAGLHIGIVMGLILGAVRGGLALSERAALFWPCKQIAACAALAAGAAYMTMTGMHVPILRSFAMACLFTLGVLAGRRAISVRGLALAATVIMLIEPQEVVGVSFQMSFSAVLALIAGYEALRPHLHRLYGQGERHRRFLLHVTGLALTSALAGTASAPYAAHHFGHFQLYFITANMLAVPLTAMWVMPLGLIALALMPLHLESLALLPMGWGIDAILWIARETSSWPGARIAVPHIPPWGLVAASFGIAWLGLFRSRLRLLGAAPLLGGLLSAAFVVPPDILVSSDARLVALRTQGGAVLYDAAGGTPERFTLDAWRQYWAAEDEADTMAETPDCQQAACLLRARDGRPAALLVRGGPASAWCGRAAIVISHAPLRDRCPGVKTIDRFTVWREGSQAVWLDPAGPRVLTDHEYRGERPWVPDPFAGRGGR